MNLALRLRYDDKPQRPAIAFWLAGADVAEWLEAAASTSPQRDALRWLVVPGESHGSVRGVLAVADATVAALPRSVPFGVLGERLYVPVAARFDPPARDDEVAALLPNDEAPYVWLPAEGLIRCDGSALRSTHELLRAPPRVPVAWDAAVPGEKLNARLLSIRPDVPLDVAGWVDAARGDIGEQAGDWRELPPAPGEPWAWRGLLSRAFPWLGLVGMLVLFLLVPATAEGSPTIVPLLLFLFGVGLIAGWAFGMLSGRFSPARQADRGSESSGPTRERRPVGTARGGSGFGGVGGWVGGWLVRQRQHFREKLDELRHRELRRLLHLLAEQPDEGLKFALPLAGDAPRGFAPPGTRLTSRNLDFSLAGAGGGAADVWDVDDRYRVQLMARYRELANREIALGRHRRAAYIFASLLGDWHAAAQTLADGGCFREAATIYDQHLKNSRAAAACLERGGLLSEAIVIYAGCDEFEKCGELHERLDQGDLAEQAFRRAVDQHRERSDFLSAARLLEQRLRAPDEAFDVLVLGWPDSAQASACLRESFALLARRADHGRAARHIAAVSAVAVGSPTSLPVTDCLADVATSYPDATIQSVAADRTRVLVAQRLAQELAAEREPLLDAIRRLAPQDRLLHRDCDRFRQRRAEQAPPRRRSPNELRLIRRFALPEADWRTAVAHGQAFYAAGWRGNEVIPVRGFWDGTTQLAPGRRWQLPAERAGGPILMAMAQRDRADLFVHVFGAPGLSHPVEFPATDRSASCSAYGHRAFSESTIAFELSTVGEVLTCLEMRGDDLWITRYATAQGKLTDNTAVGVCGELLDRPAAVAFATRADDCLLSSSLGMFRIRHHRPSTGSAFTSVKPVPSAPAHQLAVSPSGKHVAACGEVVSRLWWGDPLSSPSAQFASGLDHPRVCFLRSAILFVASAGQVEAYRIGANELPLLGSVDGPGALPLAVLPLPHPRIAAVVTQAGEVFVYEVP